MNIDMEEQVIEQGNSFEVDCYDVVKTHQVILTSTATGDKYSAPVLKWEWKNSFYAYVTFIFRGQEFTVLAEVHPEMDY